MISDGAKLLELGAYVRWNANTVHQGYHDDLDDPAPVSWLECNRPICVEARAALELAGLGLNA